MKRPSLAGRHPILDQPDEEELHRAKVRCRQDLRYLEGQKSQDRHRIMLCERALDGDLNALSAWYDSEQPSAEGANIGTFTDANGMTYLGKKT